MNGSKITIEPVTRIEGHARVTIQLNDQNEVDHTFFHVDEFRGLEKFSEGRPYFEMPQITQRICGICPVSHHLASAKACDEIIGVKPPRPAILLRELLHMAQFAQSHAMHFFYLAAPDLLLGFDSDPATRNIFGIIDVNPELARKAVKLRRFGQQIIESLGGKRVHPNFAVSGGVNAPLTSKNRDEIGADCEIQISFAKEAIEIVRDWMMNNDELVQGFASFPSNYMGMVDGRGCLQLYDGQIKICGIDGDILGQFLPHDYLEFVAEHVEPWTFLKFPYYRKLGWPQGSYRVGPLGRLNVIEKINTPLAGKEFEYFKQMNTTKPAEGSLYYHHARMIELLFALERIGDLIEDEDILSKEIRNHGTTKLTGHGVGVIEAPRGTLFHDYTTDENGLMRRVNLIVATGHNNWAMNRAVETVAKAFLNGGKLTEGMLNRVESAIRCYDPCLSCSTHAIGKMPLEIVLATAEGIILDRITH